VTVTDLNGIRHQADLQATTLFEAAATATTIFREQGWSGEALTPNSVLRVEVQGPSTVHDVPLKAVERWLRSPNTSPKQMIAKRRTESAGKGDVRSLNGRGGHREQ
jgi:hypothetical protein